MFLSFFLPALLLLFISEFYSFLPSISFFFTYIFPFLFLTLIIFFLPSVLPFISFLRSFLSLSVTHSLSLSLSLSHSIGLQARSPPAACLLSPGRWYLVLMYKSSSTFQSLINDPICPCWVSLNFKMLTHQTSASATAWCNKPPSKASYERTENRQPDIDTLTCSEVLPVHLPGRAREIKHERDWNPVAGAIILPSISRTDQ